MRAPQYGHCGFKRRASNPFSAPIGVRLAPPVMPRADRRGKAAQAQYGRALANALADCAVQYKAPRNVQSMKLKLWHKSAKKDGHIVPALQVSLTPMRKRTRDMTGQVIAIQKPHVIKAVNSSKE